MSGVHAYCQLNAATTVTMPYGIRMDVRTVPRPNSVRCMSRASSMPSTNSMITEITVMIAVTFNACHQ